MTTTDTTTDPGATSATTAPEPPTSGAAATIWAALTANPDSTASAIAKAAKVSNTTAGKALTALEKDGLAARTRGTGAGRSRIPDTWTPNLPATDATDATDVDAVEAPTPTPAPTPDTGTDTGTDTRTDTRTDTGTGAETDPEAGAGAPEPASAEPADDEPETTTPTNPPTDEAPDDGTETLAPTRDTATTVTEDDQTTAADGSTAEEASDEPAREPADGQSAPTPDKPAGGDTVDSDEAEAVEQDSASSDSTSTAAEEEVPEPDIIRHGRLGKGELRGMVADYIASHLDRDFTPTQLSRILHRSSGAISNALEALVDKEEAVQTREQPRAYAHRDAKVDLSQPVTRRATSRRAAARRAHATATGAAGLIARAVAAHTQAASLDAEHPDQPGWGRYALTARTTLARLLDVPTGQIHLAAEARTDTEFWVRMTITDPTITDPTGTDPTGTDPTAGGGGTPTTTAAPTPDDTPDDTAETGDTATETAVEPAADAATETVAEAVAGTELVFTAPWDEPTKILAISACPSCGNPAPTHRIAHLADLGALVGHTSTRHQQTDTSSGADVAPELRNHPTHEPACPYAAA
jgi:hypothetical protein